MSTAPARALVAIPAKIGALFLAVAKQAGGLGILAAQILRRPI